MEKEESKKEINLICETGIGFSQRDTNVKSQEDKGLLDFVVIKNDGKNVENLRLLTDLKNIIAKQLPKMPKEYIVRLVFDKKHESMVILKSKFFLFLIFLETDKRKKVLGGICYRPNITQGFIEIAFLAISSMEQVKGFGTRLMNKLKDHCKTQGIHYFLTYADNNAIGYFKKQGFSTALKMPLEKWKGYIKDYDGGTLMEATCCEFIDYSTLSQNLKEQKEEIQDIAMKFLNVKRAHSYNELDEVLRVNKIDNSELHKYAAPNTIISEKIFNLIPGMLESGWTYEKYKKQMEKEKTEKKTFIQQCRNIIAKIKNNENAWPFLTPVDSTQVPLYYEKISNPMDLQTLEKNLESGIYKFKEDFVKDLKLIFSNCRTFNAKNSFYYKSAVNIESLIESDIKNLTDDN